VGVWCGGTAAGADGSVRHHQVADASAEANLAFSNGLSETGYFDGRNVTVEYHWLDGHFDRLPALMAEIVRRRVAVIATPNNTLVAATAKPRRRRFRSSSALARTLSKRVPGGSAAIRTSTWSCRASRLPRRGVASSLDCSLTSPVSVTSARAFARLLGAAGQPANGLSTANARWGPVRHAGVGHVGAAAGTPHRGRARQSSRAMSAFRRAHSPKRRLIRSSPSAKSAPTTSAAAGAKTNAHPLSCAQ
jgi:hypothetical protein